MPFRSLLGHHLTLTLLSRATAAGTLPPSLIFAGPEGVGKRAAALALAQALNCPTPVAPTDRLALDACGECPVCRRIDRGLHPDVTVVEPGETGSIKIDVVREAIRQTTFKPFEARRRVIIFNDADGLGDDAQNALLKTLEEPPPGSVLILVTAHPHRLLATVRSRCPVVRFAPLLPADVAQWLMQAHGIAETEARAVAAVSRGSLAAARETAHTGVEAVREAAGRVLATVSDARDPRARLEATADIVGKGKGSGASERDSLSTHLHALGLAAARPGCARHRHDGQRGQRRPGAVADAPVAVVWRRPDRESVCGHRPRARRARPQCQPEDRRRLGRVELVGFGLRTSGSGSL